MKRLPAYLLFIAFLLASLMSCKKDDNTPTNYVPGISGSWKYVKGVQTEKYLHIYPNSTYSILSADNQGIRNRSDGIILVTANQIMVDAGSNEGQQTPIYNYAIKGDTLKLSKPQVFISLVKDKTAPDTTAWIKTVTAAVKIKAPIETATDITYDGSLIWYGNGYDSYYIYKINPTNSSKDSVKVTQYAWAVEADGTNLWLSSNGSSTISKINKSTGATSATSVNMGAWIYGIAKDNNFLWCYSHNENTLYKYNTTDNTIALSTPTKSYWTGLAMAGSNLYVASNGILHKCTLSPLQGTASFYLPGYYIYGVAYDGTSFWVSAYKYTNDSYDWPEIIKLNGVD